MKNERATIRRFVHFSYVLAALHKATDLLVIAQCVIIAADVGAAEGTLSGKEQCSASNENGTNNFPIVLKILSNLRHNQ